MSLPCSNWWILSANFSFLFQAHIFQVTTLPFSPPFSFHLTREWIKQGEKMEGGNPVLRKYKLYGCFLCDFTYRIGLCVHLLQMQTYCYKKYHTMDTTVHGQKLVSLRFTSNDISHTMNILEKNTKISVRTSIYKISS
jgi:hypothetical protein